jgi:hypothetical protein
LQALPVGKDDEGQVLQLILLERFDELANFGVSVRRLDVEPLIRHMVAGEEIFNVVRGRRPTVAQHADALEGRAVVGPPVVEQVV